MQEYIILDNWTVFVTAFGVSAIWATTAMAINWAILHVTVKQLRREMKRGLAECDVRIMQHSQDGRLALPMAKEHLTALASLRIELHNLRQTLTGGPLKDVLVGEVLKHPRFAAISATVNILEARQQQREERGRFVGGKRKENK